MTFGPNPKGVIDGPAFHHRGEKYKVLIEALKDEFRTQWGSDYDYLFLSGSGTMANEAVMSSCLLKFQVPKANMEFSGRLARLAETYDRHSFTATREAYARYETAEATLVVGMCSGDDFVDCVSSFPYYKPPLGAMVWTTVSSKQLGAYPVCSVVAVKKGCWSLFEGPSKYSILNLSRYMASQEKGMSPHTPSIPLLADLLKQVQLLNDGGLDEFRSWVDERRQTVVDSGLKVSGEGPTLLIEDERVTDTVAQKFGLYKNGLGFYQLFLYSSPEVEIGKFCKELLA